MYVRSNITTVIKIGTIYPLRNTTDGKMEFFVPFDINTRHREILERYLDRVRFVGTVNPTRKPHFPSLPPFLPYNKTSHFLTYGFNQLKQGGGGWVGGWKRRWVRYWYNARPSSYQTERTFSHFAHVNTGGFFRFIDQRRSTEK